ncbi:MAG TPA: hypothetical protein VNV42_03475 [Solirubrobacteraceae bacterium]|jgi:hypothetical protein|nr:hypothetical protein [Solirubrobacteraceae bacterium]
MPLPREGIVVAVIAAVSALAGAAVGGAITYLSNEHLQTREVAREEARQTTAARAVARILMGEYRAEYVRMGGMLAEGEYEPASYHERVFVSQVGLEDRKLLASRLTEDDWVAVSKASRGVEEVQGALEARHGEGAIDSEERETLARARGACSVAYNDLTPLAEGHSDG